MASVQQHQKPQTASAQQSPLPAESILMCDEATLLAGFMEDFQPKNTIETHLVQQMARIAAAQNAMTVDETYLHFDREFLRLLWHLQRLQGKVAPPAQRPVMHTHPSSSPAIQRPPVRRPVQNMDQIRQKIQTYKQVLEEHPEWDLDEDVDEAEFEESWAYLQSLLNKAQTPADGPPHPDNPMVLSSPADPQPKSMHPP